MITGAALATVNRLPVLLLPGDIFARRNVAPVLQQLESRPRRTSASTTASSPSRRYWDRIYRPDQLITSLPEAMRVLTVAADTGAVTLSLPQDVQTEAYRLPGPSCSTSASGRSVGHRPMPCRCSARHRRRSASAASPADRRRRRRSLQRSHRRRSPSSSSPNRHPCGRDPGRARASLPFDHPQNVGASASPARWQPTALPARPIWSSASARAIPISPPPRRRCSRIRTFALSTSTSPSSTPTSIRDCRSWPTRGSRSKSCPSPARYRVSPDYADRDRGAPIANGTPKSIASISPESGRSRLRASSLAPVSGSDWAARCDGLRGR